MLTRTFNFTLSSTGDGYSVRLACDTARPPVAAPFYFDLNPDSRLNQVVKAIGDGSVTYDDLREVGAILFTALLYGEVRERFVLERQEAEEAAGADLLRLVLRLDLPAELRHLPWECLYEEARGFGFLLNDARYVLVRDTPCCFVPPDPASQRALPLRMLVVIPQGSQLNVDKELHGLDMAISRLGAAIELSVLDGEVTPDRLNERANAERWDVVHFIGHGDVAGGTVRVRLNSEDPDNPDQWVDGEVFATFFHRRVPRLIVLNCCYGGSQASLRTFSGLGPYLLRAGVPAVVAMQYEIPDTVAIKFAEKFYGELLSGTEPGRIDFALTVARLSLYQNQTKDRPHSFITPVLYLMPGHETLVELWDRRSPAFVSRPDDAPSLTPQTELPQDLLDAFRDRRIVPVIGPDLLCVGAMRSRNPPGPRRLAEQLAREAHFPRMDLFERSDADAESAGVWLLPAVCQHYERKKERWKLLTAVQRAYKDFPPPPAICQIASWDVPGVICAYFDGLLTEAMTGAHKTFRALQSVDQKAAGYRDETLIVHMRGVYSESDSLILTERDQELLLDRMMNLSSHVADLARKTVGRSLLYLGVSPRDLLVRRLTRALRGNGRNQGPMFFVSPDRTVEDAYWDDYNVQWLPMPLDVFLDAVAEIGARPSTPLSAGVGATS